MAIKIRVTNGPDAGREFIVQRQRVLIGAEADADIRLNDTQLKGHLVVEHRNAAYHVSNMLQYPVWLDGQALAINERRVWYDQACLQPSAVTSLVLLTDHSAVAPDDDRRVIESDAGARFVLRTSWIIAGALIVLALMFLASGPGGSRPGGSTRPLSSSAVRRESLRILEALADPTYQAAAQRRGVSLDWRQLSDSLISARLAEARTDRLAVTADYRRARESARRLSQAFRKEARPDLPASPSDDAIRDTLEMAERIASQKLLEFDQS